MQTFESSPKSDSLADRPDPPVMDTPDKQRKGKGMSKQSKSKAKAAAKLSAPGHQSFENPMNEE